VAVTAWALAVGGQGEHAPTLEIIWWALPTLDFYSL